MKCVVCNVMYRPRSAIRSYQKGAVRSLALIAFSVMPVIFPGSETWRRSAIDYRRWIARRWPVCFTKRALNQVDVYVLSEILAMG